MEKKEMISRRGQEAYEKMQQQGRDWVLTHPKEVKVRQHERDRKGGKYYGLRIKYNSTGLPHDRNLVRWRHANRYRQYKQLIAPESQIHHQWAPGTADYTGVALVEADLAYTRAENEAEIRELEEEIVELGVKLK